jgi:hypothetical protein
MRMVYIIFGHIRNEVRWYVAAYDQKAKAIEHSRLAAMRATELWHWKSPTGGNWQYANEPKPKNEYDPQMRLASTGTHYGILEVPFLRDLPGTVKLEVQSKNIWERLDDDSAV